MTGGRPDEQSDFSMATNITHLTPRSADDVQPVPQIAPALPDGGPAPDATLPPTPLKKRLAADGAAVYVLSSGSALVDAVTTAGGDQFAISARADVESAALARRFRQCASRSSRPSSPSSSFSSRRRANDRHDEATLAGPLAASRRPRSAYGRDARSAWLLAIALVTVLVAGVLIGVYLGGE